MARTPKYCHHKGTDRAFVTIQGDRIYLGKFNSPESRDRYDEAILKWRRLHDTSGKHSTTVGQLCLAFIEHADQFYRDKAGKPTGEAQNFRYAVKPMVQLFRNLPCSEFGPRKLKAVREDLMKRHCRTQVNKHVHRIRQVFRWGVENEMLPGSVLVELETVKGLAAGRSGARESEPVLPVPDDDLRASMESMTANVKAMVQLQLLTAARPSEVRLMRVGDIDTAGDVWTYQRDSHKNAWRGKSRTIFIGPKGQTVLMPFIGNAVQADQFLFLSPRTGKPSTLNGLESSIRKACIRRTSITGLRAGSATTRRRTRGGSTGWMAPAPCWSTPKAARRKSTRSGTCNSGWRSCGRSGEALRGVTYNRPRTGARNGIDPPDRPSILPLRLGDAPVPFSFAREEGWQERGKANAQPVADGG